MASFLPELVNSPKRSSDGTLSLLPWDTFGGLVWSGSSPLCARLVFWGRLDFKGLDSSMSGSGVGTAFCSPEVTGLAAGVLPPGFSSVSQLLGSKSSHVSSSVLVSEQGLDSSIGFCRTNMYTDSFVCRPLWRVRSLLSLFRP